MRPEIKFDSFDDLIQTIKNDVEQARVALDEEIYKENIPGFIELDECLESHYLEFPFPIKSN